MLHLVSDQPNAFPTCLPAEWSVVGIVLVSEQHQVA